ncbi:MAG TPA: hypothetical protein VNI20_08095 [Fimbriimonadaceae bacterium]|nr:hypothetical protein [Fimbriimonadaceae bacterium]
MSQEVTLSSFNPEAQTWIDAFNHAEPDQRRDSYEVFKRALARLPYMKVTQGKITIKRMPMLEISASFQVVRRHEDLVKIDLVNVFSQNVAGEDAAIHCFESTSKGFNMYFAYRPKNAYCMGGLLVVTSIRD